MIRLSMIGNFSHSQWHRDHETGHFFWAGYGIVYKTLSGQAAVESPISHLVRNQPLRDVWLAPRCLLGLPPHYMLG